MTWELLWKLCFIGVIAAFVVMVVLTSVLGARDVKRLMEELRDDEEET